MKPVKTKAQLRQEIDSQIDAFLSKGGEVLECQPGQSGRHDNSNPFSQAPNLLRSNQQRTPLTDEIQAIESRRKKPKAKTPPTHKHRRRETKALITDDFGEPLRWITK